MRWRMLILVFLIIGLSHTYAQQLIFENVSDKLGLPSKECYNVMQDSKRNIWISSDAGLCKYDGNSLKIFDKKNGFPENSYAITEDKKGRIWIGTSNCRIFCYTKGQLYEVPYSRPIVDSIILKMQLIYSIKSIDIGRLYFSTQYHSFELDLLSQKLSQHTPVDSAADLYFRKEGNEIVNIKRGFLTPQQNAKHAKFGFLLLEIDQAGKKTTTKIPFIRTGGGAWRVLTTTNKKGYYYISFFNTFVEIDKQNQFKTYTVGNKIISLYADNNNGLWVGTYKKGAYYYPDLSKSDLPMTILPDYSVSGTCEDNEGGIWCTTLEKGTFYSRNKNIFSYENIEGLDKQAEMLKIIGDEMYISTLPGKINRLNKKGELLDPIIINKNSAVKDVLKIDGISYISGYEFIQMTDEQKRNKYIKTKESPLLSSSTQMVQGPEKRVFVLNGSKNVEEIIDGTLTDNGVKAYGTGICLFFSRIANKLLVGAKDGAYEANLQDLSLNKIEGIGEKVVKIIEMKNGQLCFLTKESGIYLMDKNNITRIDEKLPLPASIFYDIAEDAYGHVWIASNKGLIKITPSFPSIQAYTTVNGLPSNIIYNIAINDPYIFLSTEYGISRFPINENLVNTTAPFISLDQFKINEFDTTYQEGMSLYYDQNSITMTFYLPMFKDMGNTSFLYRLKGGEEKTELVKGNKLILNNLPPGNYLLTVYAVNNDGVKSKVPLILHFEIKKPFWANPLSIFFACVLFILMIYIIIRIITKNIKTKEKKKTAIHQQISEYRLNALQAKMNPHFIFNSLNSIQHYILSNQNQYAYDYLARFSTLIRQVLINSESNTISLEKEIELLEVYIELEQRRFQNRFSYEITYDKNVALNQIEIPVMLIQPFVENAIWHGIMNLGKDKTGKLQITFELENEILKISIEDNGIGRKEAGKLKKLNEYDSVGILFSEKRLEMMKLISGKTSRITVTDLYDEDGIAKGTKVDIFLPV